MLSVFSGLILTDQYFDSFYGCANCHIGIVDDGIVKTLFGSFLIGEDKQDGTYFYTK